MSNKELVTGAGLARIWGVSREWVSLLARQGRIVPVHTFDGVRLFRPTTRRPKALQSGRKPAVVIR